MIQETHNVTRYWKSTIPDGKMPLIDASLKLLYHQIHSRLLSSRILGIKECTDFDKEVTSWFYWDLNMNIMFLNECPICTNLNVKFVDSMTFNDRKKIVKYNKWRDF